MSKITIGLFFGGKSTEHEVSVITGLQAFTALERDKYDCVPVYISKSNELYTGEGIGKIEQYCDIPALLSKSRRVVLLNKSLYEVTPKKINMRKPLATLDVALPCVHGTNVEDGSLQGFFEMCGLPYAGCDVLSSAVGMDKAVQKAVLKDAGIPVLDCVTFTAKEFIGDKNAVLGKITLPAIIKPVNLGSSIGIKIAHSLTELSDAIEHALMFADRVLAEPAIVSLKEVNCAVLGDKDSAEASECEEPVNEGGILDFDDKYSGGGKSVGDNAPGVPKSQGMANLKRKIPADITDSQRSEIRGTAVKAFKSLGCSGVARIDFLIDTESDKVWFNEINTIPGSLSFYLWEPLGTSYPQLLDRMISLALKRERERNNLNFSFSSNILSAFKGSKSGSKL
jgi:D-alanine-D-alanine ligase